MRRAGFGARLGRWLLGLALLGGAGHVVHAGAAPRLAGLFSDHMVLQRDAPLRVWGWAAPGEQVAVSLHRQQAHTKADGHGRWSLHLAPEKAGGPYEMVVSGAGAEPLRLRDVLVGEVWLCAGQSNMEWPLKDAQGGVADTANADDPLLRHVKIARRLALQPQDELAEPAVWQLSRPDTAGDFSAVAYHFARKLRRELGVPVGLVNVSWGGSEIESWMSREALQANPEMRALLTQMPASDAAFSLAYQARMRRLVQRWQGEAGGDDRPAAWSTAGFDDSHWATLKAPGMWEQQGLDGFDGQLWYRKTLQLSAAQAAKPAVLELGQVDDCDASYVNGQAVGGLCGWDLPRRYALPPGLLHEGLNQLALRVTDNGGGGGLHGDPAALRLMLGEAEEISLAGDWRARVQASLAKQSPALNDLPMLLFNGMLNPLVGYRLGGMLWYQGTSNVTRAAQYERSFAGFITDLRQRWGQGDFPFYFVQLAAFKPLADNSPAGSTWAELREAQARNLRLPNTGMAVATDLGDPLDIHPRNKRDVGLRLARLALRNQHGLTLQASGPTLRSVRVVGDALVLSFANVGGGLVAQGGSLQGFLIADASRQFQPAQARIEGTRVIVRNPAVKRPVALRFGWFDNPEKSNLFNRDGLPAAPFRTDAWPRLTESARYSL